MCLAEPATTLLAVLGGRNHARLIPERNALAEYRARLTLFLPRRFSSADVIAETQTLLTLLRGDRVEGCPPLLNVPAFAVRTDDPALLVLRKCQDFREFFFAGATEKIVSGHDFLPVEKVLLKRILAVRPDSVNCPSRKTSPKTKELEMRLISSPLTSQLADGNFANEVTKRAGRSATLMTPLYEPQTSPESLIQRELDQ